MAFIKKRIDLLNREAAKKWAREQTKALGLSEAAADAYETLLIEGWLVGRKTLLEEFEAAGSLALTRKQEPSVS